MIYLSNEDLVDFSNSHETSKEIIEAIFHFSENYDDAERIWTEPTDIELLSIWERVTKNGLIDSSAFCWGAQGSSWWINHARG